MLAMRRGWNGTSDRRLNKGQEASDRVLIPSKASPTSLNVGLVASFLLLFNFCIIGYHEWMT